MHSDDTRKATDLGEELFDGIESTREFWCRFLLCVNIIENLTNRQTLKLSQRSCMLSTIQNHMWHRVLRVSTVRLGGEGRKFFELQTFAIDLSDLRIWKKLRIANQLKILARFSDCIYPEVSIRSGTESSIFQWSAFVGLLGLCWPFFISFIYFLESLSQISVRVFIWFERPFL